MSLSTTTLIPIKIQSELRFAPSQLRFHTIGILHSGQKVVFENEQRHDWFPKTLFCFNQHSFLGFSHLPFKGKPYFVQLLLVSQADIERFNQIYPTKHYRTQNLFHTLASPELLEIWQRIHDDIVKNNQTLHQHRLFELLLMLQAMGWQFINPQNLSIIEKVEKIIASDISHDWQKSTVAQYLNMSTSKLSRLLQNQATSFSQILKNARLAHAMYLLLSGEYAVNEVALMCGYQSHSKFSSTFKKAVGMLPSQIGK